MNFTPYYSSSSGNLYEISDGSTKIIVECGVSFARLQRALEYRISDYSACVVSHEQHSDHCNKKTLAELRKRGLSVYLNGDIPNNIGTLEIKSFPVPHDVPNYGFMFRSMRDGETCVFLTDCGYTHYTFDFSPTIIAIEANWAKDLLIPGESINDRLYLNHMSIQQCIATLRANDLSKTREIVLLHLSDARSDEARFIREVQAAVGIPVYVAPRRATS
ncbi:MAG: hypothetical protein HGA87_03295 [Desulfobulbaceae bacterium]|nr:hypothetical protein [Desulfobulbaceae bacterium]